jgi:hypothetical protein
MNLSQGFQIEEPQIFVRWDSSESRFEQEYNVLNLRRVTDGYLTAYCTSLGSLSCDLGFLFFPEAVVAYSNWSSFAASTRIWEPRTMSSNDISRQHSVVPQLRHLVQKGSHPTPGVFAELISFISFANASDQKNTSE